MTTAQGRLNAILPIWYELLTQWSLDGSLVAAATEALVLDGSNAKPDAKGQLQSLTSQWSAGNFKSLPQIVLLSNADISGAQGAYAASTGTIYLNSEWLLTADQAWIQRILTEELGHALDAQLNLADTQGDEGEIFSLELISKFRSYPNQTQKDLEKDVFTIAAGETTIQAEASLQSLALENITIKGLGTETALTIDRSQDGSFYVGGTFGPNIAFIDSTSLTSSIPYSQDGFIARFDAAGRLNWTMQFGPVQNGGGDILNEMITLSNNSTLIAGRFRGSITFGNISLNEVSPEIGNGDGYIANLSPTGSVLWTKQFGSKGYEAVTSATSLADGSIAVIGSFSDNMQVDGVLLSPKSGVALNGGLNSGAPDIFTARISQNGDFLFISQAGGVVGDFGDGIAAGTDHIITSGRFTENATFGNIALASTGGTDGFIAKQGLDLAYEWVTQIRGTADVLNLNVTKLTDGSTVATGLFRSSVQLGETILNSTSSVPSAGWNGFVCQLDDNGVFKWVVQLGATSSMGFNRTIPTSDGGIVVTGNFGIGSLEIGSRVISNAAPGSDGFIAKLTSQGAVEWVSQVGGSGSQECLDATELLDKTLIVSGSFEASVNVGSDSVLTSLGGADGYIVRLNADGTWYTSPKDNGDAVFRINGNGIGQDSQSLTCILDTLDPDGMTRFPPSSTAGYTYQWEVSTDGSTNWINATSAGSNTFKYAVNTTTDANKFLRVKVGYQDDKGFNEIVYTGNAKIISGTSRNESFKGTSGIDVTFSGSGADAVATGAGNDFAKGGNGNDTFNGSDLDGDDFFDGQTEIDTLNYSASTKGVTIDFVTGVVTERALGGTGRDTFAFIENARGSSVADIFAGNSGVNVFTGGGGADTYRFMNEQTFGASTSDRIADFGSDDKIEISAAAFGVVGKTLSYASVAGTRTATAASLADKSSALVVYDPGTGQLYLNKDGATSGVSGQSGVFAVLDNKFTGLTVSNFGWAV